MSGRIPEPNFRGWFLWASIWDSTIPSVGADALTEVGTYLLARFSQGAPPSVDITDERIFYVGETHGMTRTLYSRLVEFGNSAGFGRQQRNGHYAAWRYPREFEDDIVEATGYTDPSKVYVALCPFPGGTVHRAPRGIFPGLIEAQVLWQFTNKHGRLPVLNNSGRQERRTSV